MILIMTKYHENLLKDSPLLFVVKFFSFLETKKVLKIQNETFLRITQYQLYKKIVICCGTRYWQVSVPYHLRMITSFLVACLLASEHLSCPRQEVWPKICTNVMSDPWMLFANYGLISQADLPWNSPIFTSKNADANIHESATICSYC